MRGRRVRVIRSSMNEPMVTIAEAERVLGTEADGLSVDERLIAVADMVPGFRFKGLGLSVVYLQAR